jgi:saccharopine dehydrogenase-like NADP-dependent oxidoreductase
MQEMKKRSGIMNVLLIGIGGVGEAIAKVAAERDPESLWLDKMVLANRTEARAQKLSEHLGDATRFPAEKCDANNQGDIKRLVEKYQIDLIMNASDITTNKIIFEAAFAMGCKYIDMGGESHAHPCDPYPKGYQEWIGDYFFARHQQWETSGNLAIMYLGIDPGVVNVFAKFAEQELFDELDEIAIKDGSNITVEGMDYAFGFSISAIVEEVLNPPVFWESDKGWYTKMPMSEAEVFDFPEGIGPQEIVAVEHEEPMMLPRFIGKGLKKVSFKIGLGDKVLEAMRVIQALGLDKMDKVRVGDIEVSPRDVLAATAPRPSSLGEKMQGKMCVGILVTGRKDGKDRKVFIYQTWDNAEAMQRFSCQAVVSQTAFGAVIGMELLAKGIWQGTGVLTPEAFPHRPFLELMEAYRFPYKVIEM